MSQDELHRGKLRKIDLTGQIFGKWTVLEEIKDTVDHRRWWKCRCECGVEKNVRENALKRNNTRSCKRCSKKIHGLSFTPERNSHLAMIERCYNENHKAFKNYGGRGIRVCDRWSDKKDGIINFYNDMGKKPSKNHSLDRIDVNGDYTPENCKWSTVLEQSLNRQNSWTDIEMKMLLDYYNDVKYRKDIRNKFEYIKNLLYHENKMNFKERSILAVSSKFYRINK